MVLTGLVLLFSSATLAPQQIPPAVGKGSAAVPDTARSRASARSSRTAGRRFVPSQSVSADKSVSFPVDI